MLCVSMDEEIPEVSENVVKAITGQRALALARGVKAAFIVASVKIGAKRDQTFGLVHVTGPRCFLLPPSGYKNKTVIAGRPA